MYPFTSNNNGNLSFTSTYNIHPFSSSSQFHSPHHIAMEDGTIFNDLLRQDSLLSYAHNNHNNITNNGVVHKKFSSHDIRANMKSDMGRKCGNNNGDGAGFNKPETSTTRKRASKHDRHSKIITARGPRDRRMRLSLDVAKKFFKLQDILGFDKASETVNWLLVNSKSDIHELLSHQRSSFSGVSNSASSTSKCELLSNNIDGDEQKAKSSCSSNHKEKKRASRGVRKSSYLLRPLAKETREMARKRARDRTVEKSSKLGCASGEVDQFSNIRPCLDLAMNQDVNRYGSWIVNQPENISSHFQFKQGYIGDDSSASMADNWNPSFLINYQPNGGVLLHEHDQLNYFQRLGNIWGDNN